MIRNYLLIAWRNVIRHKTHTAINVIGLALGMTCCLFILLWFRMKKELIIFTRTGKTYMSSFKPRHITAVFRATIICLLRSIR